MKIFLIICLIGLLPIAQAQNIYRTIDAEGKVTYSSIKPQGDQEVEIIQAPREPSQDEINAAREQQKTLEASLKEIQERRKAQELEKALKQQKPDKTKPGLNPGLMF